MEKQKETNKEQDFAETVYRILRDYQDDKIQKTQISVGALDDKLTVVYDTIISAALKLETSND